MKMPLFVLLLVLFLSFPSVSSKPKVSSLSVKRIFSEWKEVQQQNLSLDVPYRDTTEEVMLFNVNCSDCVCSHISIDWNQTFST
jgi:hypothetical protein